MEAATRNLTPVTLELGGKSPQIIFADADLELAAQTVVGSLVWSAGQVCSAGTRLLVDRSVRDDVVEPVVEQMRATRIGPAVESPDMGPLITEHQRSSVLGAIAAATEGGARLRTGGTDTPETATGGFYVEPTVFDEVDPEQLARPGGGVRPRSGGHGLRLGAGGARDSRTGRASG